jgi:hypothetical protein
MLLRSKPNRAIKPDEVHAHAGCAGHRINESRSESDSENGNFSGQQTGREIIFGHLRERGCRSLHRSYRRRKVSNGDPLNIWCRRCRRNLRGIIRPDFSPAATGLRHLSALPVHGAAACTFFVAHRTAGYAGHHWRNCNDQKNDCNETGKTAHACLKYKTSGLMRKPQTGSRCNSSVIPASPPNLIKDLVWEWTAASIE